MRILIDFTQIPIKKVGVGVYAFQTFTRIFSSTQNVNQYIAVVQDDDSEMASIASPSVRLVKVRSSFFRNFAFRFLLEQFYLPYLKIKYRIDAIHSLHYSFPILGFGAKKIVTIHDLSFFIYPQHHTRIKRAYFSFFIWLSTLGNKKLICVSQSTANDLQRRYDKRKLDINVVPLAKEENPPNVALEKVFKKFGLPEKYILFIGTLEPRKNIEGLIRSYAQLGTDYPYPLVVVGKRGWFYQTIFDLVDALNLKHKITFTDFVTESEKYALLRGAELFVYPSFYEGFGLPVLEAMSQGIPTITSNISSMPEVAGDAALLIDPTKDAEITEAIKLLTYNHDLRQMLHEKGLQRAKLFTWQHTAQLTTNVYDLSLHSNL